MTMIRPACGIIFLSSIVSILIGIIVITATVITIKLNNSENWNKNVTKVKLSLKLKSAKNSPNFLFWKIEEAAEFLIGIQRNFWKFSGSSYSNQRKLININHTFKGFGTPAPGKKKISYFHIFLLKKVAETLRIFFKFVNCV